VGAEGVVVKNWMFHPKDASRNGRLKNWGVKGRGTRSATKRPSCDGDRLEFPRRGKERALKREEFSDLWKHWRGEVTPENGMKRASSPTGG